MNTCRGERITIFSLTHFATLVSKSKQQKCCQNSNWVSMTEDTNRKRVSLIKWGQSFSCGSYRNVKTISACSKNCPISLSQILMKGWWCWAAQGKNGNEKMSTDFLQLRWRKSQWPSCWNWIHTGILKNLYRTSWAHGPGGLTHLSIGEDTLFLQKN